MTSVTRWSEAGFMDHLTASMTLDVSNEVSRTPTSTNTATTTSLYSGSAIDSLRRARTIPRRSLGMSVSAAVGGTMIFIRSHYTQLPSPHMQYPELSQFSDDSEAGSTEAHMA
ncbi:uncharacterized protein BO96DRAFT_488819 [Aspergillus niger CBS 101883]|uniref:uncharacterized protein n=1 Tax=Aspergillus lacticoffeatus (strain CBS 101883) TaxID=1450533 RepID=UPI000D7F207C|nr:uncharacterized protein BO96DRAFT_488819 [Aspergillus niger CBS 101883]PYH50903.1 hypothetical protein BO96DRAFT_488819 [Aspergillus niger CBS 101883]